MANLSENLQIYLRNRTDFYRTLLPRIPHPEMRAAFEKAVDLETGHPDETVPELALANLDLPDELLAAFGLLDLLKKPAYGRALGRTVISFEEAAARAQSVEQTGWLLFEVAEKHYPSASEVLHRQSEKHRLILARLIRLGDDARYHRLPAKPDLSPPPTPE
jgi:hypothetical protein